MKVSNVARRARRLRRDAVDRTGWTARSIRGGLRKAIRSTAPAHHVLIAPPGSGNIGDQAMVEAYLASVAGLPAVIVTRGPDDFTLPADLAAKATITALPSLFYGDGAAHRADLRRLGEILSQAATLSIIGADIMDGVYVLRSSIRRSSVAAAAAAAGIDTTVIGFSWNSAAPSAAWSSLRAAGDAGTRLLLRDPASAARVRDAGIPGVIETADIVFTDGRRDDAAVEGVLAHIDGPFVIVNASGLIARSVDQVPEYASVIDHLRRMGLAVVLLPHVLRDTADDLAACRAVADEVGSDGVVLIEEQLAPSAIRALARRAEFTITGRMHLAIMSLEQDIPAITLATQGKVEGLMRLFGWSELCVTPRAGMADDIIRVVDVSVSAPDARERIHRGTQAARVLAAANIERVVV